MRLIPKVSIVLISLVSLSACNNNGPVTRVKPNLNYAYMESLGAFRNSSATSGALYYWDVSENELTELGNLTMGRKVNATGDVEPETPLRKAIGTREQSAVNGVGFNISLPKATETSLSAKLSSEFNFHAKENEVEIHKDTYSILSANYKALGGAAKGVDRKWKIRNAIKDKDHLVFVTNLIYTKDHLVSAGFNTGGNPLQLKIRGEEIFSIDGSRLSTFKCVSEIAPVPCFFKVSVVDPHYTSDGNLDYGPARYQKAELARAFRNQ